ncbi:pentatricopeptide repeat-containing protein [Canna indica]|uniref:Pentatricopeptide repeat-containing protein n=1 Tax=Canna indica TaxID=4628 RepID=A0AAQ3PZZ6_9LILI|nr:pentatricopeptide repeat-containing protein [Canna indica]
MRSPTYRWAAITRAFSTSTLKSPSFKTAAGFQSIQSLASAGRLKDAIRSIILRRHLGRPVHPDCFVAVLKHCAEPEILVTTRQLHAHMIVTCFDQDPFICNHLISIYGKCGFLTDAHWVLRKLRKKKLRSWNILIALYCKFGFLSEGKRLFDEMPRWDVVSWNTMIAAYDQWGPCEEALEFFVRMTRSDCKVDNFGLSSVISACANLRFVQNGMVLHGFSVKIGLDSHVEVGSAVVGLYSKCEQLDDARRVFDELDTKELFTWNTMLDGYIQCSKIGDALSFFENMPEKNVVSWTTIVAGCSRHNKNEKAIETFHRMQKLGLRPDWVSYVSVLDACVWLLDLKEGSKIHAKIVKSGFEADRIVGSALVALYAKGGCLTDARSVIHGLAAVDDYSWSVLIAEYVKHGLFDSACELFESLAVKSVPLWNALIGAYSAVGLSEEAYATFKRMQVDGKCGDEYTFGSLLVGSFHLGLRFGEQLHSHIRKIGVGSSTFVASALINMYSANLNCQASERIFKLVEYPNPIVWSSMISGYALNNLTKDAMHTFALMISLGIQPDNVSLSLILDACSRLLDLHGGTQVHAFAYRLGYESDVVVGSALIDMYAKCGSINCASHAFTDIHRHTVFSWTALVNGHMKSGMYDIANKLFDIMPERNNVSWNVMLSGYAKNGLALEALQIYRRMGKSGLLPDLISFTTLLAVCIDFVLRESGKQVHAQIIKNGYHMDRQINFYLTLMYQNFEEFCHTEKFSSGSSDSIIMAAADRAEPNTISENIKLLASVYFSYYNRENFQSREDC